MYSYNTITKGMLMRILIPYIIVAYLLLKNAQTPYSPYIFSLSIIYLTAFEFFKRIKILIKQIQQ